MISANDLNQIFFEFLNNREKCIGKLFEETRVYLQYWMISKYKRNMSVEDIKDKVSDVLIILIEEKGLLDKELKSEIKKLKKWSAYVTTIAFYQLSKTYRKVSKNRHQKLEDFNKKEVAISYHSKLPKLMKIQGKLGSIIDAILNNKYTKKQLEVIYMGFEKCCFDNSINSSNLELKRNIRASLNLQPNQFCNFINQIIERTDFSQEKVYGYNELLKIVERKNKEGAYAIGLVICQLMSLDIQKVEYTNSWLILYNLGICLQRLGKFDMSIARFEALIDIVSNNPKFAKKPNNIIADSYNQIGNIYEKRPSFDYQRAKEFYLKAARYNPLDIIIQFNIYNIYVIMEQDTLAQNIYEKWKLNSKFIELLDRL